MQLVTSPSSQSRTTPHLPHPLLLPLQQTHSTSTTQIHTSWSTGDTESLIAYSSESNHLIRMPNEEPQYDPYIPSQNSAGGGGTASAAAPGNQRTAALQAVSSSFVSPTMRSGRWALRKPDAGHWSLIPRSRRTTELWDTRHEDRPVSIWACLS